tara:strand:+ start:1653 stop:1757 length:105 start_codon:yes stop_codon:yes gene_type:complete
MKIWKDRKRKEKEGKKKGNRSEKEGEEEGKYPKN